MLKKASMILFGVALTVALAQAAFAGGSREVAPKTAPAATAVGAGRPVAHPGKLIVYPTLADYERETGKTITTFHQAPELARLVKEGKLPPLAQRLPEQPLVLQPLDSIGRYGGSLANPMHDPNIEGADTSTVHFEPLLKVNFYDLEPQPNVAEGWHLSKDGRKLILYLRKGMKWSDGAPFTAADFMYWYDDDYLNPSVTPVKPLTWTPGGKPIVMKKINPYEVEFDFAVPYFGVLNTLAVGQHDPFLPMHYMKQFDPKYNPNADSNAVAAGYSSWVQAYLFHADSGADTETNHDVHAPSLGAFVLTNIDSQGNKYFTRNPYYFKIDTAGNQLPYVNQEVGYLMQDKQVMTLKAVAGAFTTTGVETDLKNYPLYKENEAKGKYHTLLWTGGKGADYALALNLNVKDPVLREVFNHLRFREALSLAINRKEINNVLFFGKGVPRQATTLPTSSFYESWMGSFMANYDPQKANALLDELGLKRGPDGVRLMPNGKPFSLILDWYFIGPMNAELPQLVAEYWTKVGIKTSAKQVERSYYTQLESSGNYEVGWFTLPGLTEYTLEQDPYKILPPFTDAAPAWGQWLLSNGKNGEEPPATVRHLIDLVEQFHATEPGSAEYSTLGKEIFTIFTKNLYNIGLVGMAPVPLLVRNDLLNTPTQVMMNKPTWAWDYRFFQLFDPDQWYFAAGS